MRLQNGNQKKVLLKDFTPGVVGLSTYQSASSLLPRGIFIYEGVMKMSFIPKLAEFAERVLREHYGYTDLDFFGMGDEEKIERYRRLTALEKRLERRRMNFLFYSDEEIARYYDDMAAKGLPTGD